MAEKQKLNELICLWLNWKANKEKKLEKENLSYSTEIFILDEMASSLANCGIFKLAI